MASDVDKLPDELPEKPEGFTRQMKMHIRMGAGVGQASYSVHNADGVLMPFSYAYRVDRRHPENDYKGFILPGHNDKSLTWDELRAIWPDWIKAARLGT